MRRTAGLVISVGLLITACQDSGDAPGAGSSEMPPAAYTVRGVIESVAGDEVSVHHEAVPGFEGRDGSKSDMMSMTMSFGIGDGVDRALLKPGAKVAMTFEVHWDARPALRATKFKALPASTELKLE